MVLRHEKTQRKKLTSDGVERVVHKLGAISRAHDKSIVRLWRLIGVCLSSAFCLSLSGCGNGLAQVSGQVTLDGQPVHGGKGDTRVTILLLPADGVGANAIGLADENGNYKIATASQTGVRPGDYFVSCSVSTLGVSGPVADPKYANAKTSGLKLTVQPGKNEFNIPLQSPPKKKASRFGA